MRILSRNVEKNETPPDNDADDLFSKSEGGQEPYMREECYGCLPDVDHSRQILEIRFTGDHFRLLIFGLRINDCVGHVQTVSQTQILSHLSDRFCQLNHLGCTEPAREQ